MKGGIYAVTFRLADSVPQSVRQEWLWERKDIVQTARCVGRKLAGHEREKLRKLHGESVERYLRTGHGSCWMKRNNIAAIVASALIHFDGKRYRLLAWSIMPNHVHVVVQSFDGHPLSSIIHSWKRHSAREANKLLGRGGSFWQVEYYDHLIRDKDDLLHHIEYTWNNSDVAGLKNWAWRWKMDGAEIPQYTLQALAKDEEESSCT